MRVRVGATCKELGSSFDFDEAILDSYCTPMDSYWTHIEIAFSPHFRFDDGYEGSHLTYSTVN